MISRRHADNAVVNGKLRVCAKRCSQCLFTDAKIVGDDRKLALLAECRRTGKYFLCHKSTIAGTAVVCRGFYDEQESALCQVAQRLGLVEFVQVPA